MKELEASEETQLSVINEVSVVDVENNEVIDKNDIHHEGKLLSDVEEYPNVDKDEREMKETMIVEFTSKNSLILLKKKKKQKIEGMDSHLKGIGNVA